MNSVFMGYSDAPIDQVLRFRSLYNALSVLLFNLYGFDRPPSALWIMEPFDTPQETIHVSDFWAFSLTCGFVR